MKVGDLRTLLQDVPDDADIDFADGNYGGWGYDLSVTDIDISDDKTQVLIRPPYWEACD